MIFVCEMKKDYLILKCKVIKYFYKNLLLVKYVKKMKFWKK